MINYPTLITSCFLVLIGLSALAFSCYASEITLSPKTIRILNIMDEWRSKMTTEDRNAAKVQNRNGDKAYKRKNYPVAFREYDNSYPNFPNAYAYIMSGDSYWRMVLALTINAIPDEHHCIISNKNFPDDVDFNNSQTYEVGIALAIKDNETKLINSSLYKRAIEIDKCLRKMFDFYKTQAVETCVDLNQLKACLGKPLIK